MRRCRGTRDDRVGVALSADAVRFTPACAGTTRPSTRATMDFAVDKRLRDNTVAVVRDPGLAE